MRLDTRFLGDASKNCTAWVRGIVYPTDEGKRSKFLCLDDVSTAATGRRPNTLQLVSALWTLQEKMGLRIWTEDDDFHLEHLLLLMESRNFIRFDRSIQLEPWRGNLYLEPFNVVEEKYFWFQLDFDKSFAEKHK